VVNNLLKNERKQLEEKQKDAARGN